MTPTSPAASLWLSLGSILLVLLPPPALQAQLASTFIAVGERGAILTSGDGVTWTVRPTTTAARLRSVAVAGTKAVVVGEGGAIYTSNDTAKWGSAAVPVAETLRGVAHGAGRTVAVGGQTAAVILGSADGVTWVQETVPALGKLRSVAWNGSRFLAVGAGGAACTSLDGRTWTTVNPGTTERLDFVVWHQGTFKVVSETGRVSATVDGSSWSFSQISAPAWLEGLSGNGPTGIVVGAGGRILTSTDGATWTGRNSGVGLTLHGVTWTGAGSPVGFDPVVALGTLAQAPSVALVRGTPATDGGVTFSATLSGATPVSYQWLLNGAPVAGATTASLNVAAAALRRGALYALRVANAQGVGISPPELVLPGGPPAAGALWGMGSNTMAQLGTGRPVAQDEPIPVATNVVRAEFGFRHFLYLRGDGTLWGVGSNSSGQLGAGLGTHVSTPVLLATQVAAFAAGSNHTLYVKTDATLWALGANASGQLGVGDLTSRVTPVQVATGVTQVWAGGNSSAFLRNDQTLWAMGDNTYRQVANVAATQVPQPAQVAASVTAAALGETHLLLLKTDQTLWGQGRNLYGQLGLGHLVDQPAPAQIAADVKGMSAGGSHSHFVRQDGTLWGMGLNANGQLGTGNATQAASPVQIARDVQRVAAGNRHTLWIALDGSLWGTGWANYGALLVAGGSTLTPRLLNPGNRGLAAGRDISAFITTDGTLWTSGINYNGAAGNGLPTYHQIPVLIDDSGVVGASAAVEHTLYAKADRSLWAFGWPTGTGQFGIAVREKLTPYLAASDVVYSTAGTGYSLLVGPDGSVRASGVNDVGQLGNGTLTARNFWGGVASNGAAVAASVDHTALVLRDGTLRMTGINTRGQLGLGHTTNQAAFVTVDTGVVAVACGAEHTLYLRQDGTVWAMGRNQIGQLGNGAVTNRNLPVLVGTGTVGIATGYNHSLHLRQDGSLWANGAGGAGQLGTGGTADQTLPVEVARDVILAAGGVASTYFVKADGVLWATGANSLGELGIGSLVNQSTPVAVARNVTALATAPLASHMLFVQTPDVAAPRPEFATSPRSTRLTEGQPLLLTVTVTGEGPIDIQWFRDGIALPGAKGPQLSVPYARALDAGVYHAVATNLGGATTSASAFVGLTGSTAAQFAVVGDGGVILTSPDGTAWTARTSPVTRRLRGVVGTATQFLAVGEAGLIVGSTDGVSWRPRTSGVAHTLRGIAVSPGGRFVAVGGETGPLILHSEDGANWVTAAVTGTARLRAVAWGGDRFLAVGTGGAAYTSPDGVDWTPRPTGATERLDGILWNGLAFQVISERGLAYTSTDGTAWTAASARPPAWVEGLAWDGTRHLAVGARGRIALAGSGVAWSFPASGTQLTLHGAAWSGPVSTPPNASVLAADLLRQAPAIRDQPAGADRFAGENVVLGVTADGAGPFQYQWYREGALLPGATGAALRLPAVTLAQAGRYHVVVSNAFGAVPSASAQLNVTEPTLADADGDGVSDWREVVDGTDPRDAASLRRSSVGLVAHYAFSGNAEDSSGRGVHGTVVGAALVPDRRGNPNGAYRFDGTSARIEVPHAAHQNALPFSVSVWFRTPATAGQPAGGGALVSKYLNATWNGWFIPAGPATGVLAPAYLPNGNNNVIGGYNARPPFQSEANLADGRWHQAVLTVSTTGAVLYVDGVEQSRQGWRGTPQATVATHPLLLGMYAGGDTPELTYFRGELDDVRLYHKALTEEEVRRLNAEESETGRVPVDLASWAAKVAPAHTATRIAWGNGRFVAVGTGSTLVSPDGEAWTLHNVPGTTFADVAAGNGLFVAGATVPAAGGTGSVGALLTSLDGVSWTTRHTTSPRVPVTVVHGAGRFVAFTFDGDFVEQILTSEDGLTWTPRASGFGERVHSAQWTGSQFIAATLGAVLSSPDGVTWTRRAFFSNGAPALSALAGGPGRWVAGGYNTDGPTDRLWSTEDGLVWTLRPAAADQPVRFLREGGGNFIGLFGSGQILTSGDGLAWTVRSQVTTFPLTGAAWSGSRWVAVGPGAVVAAGASLAEPLPSPLLAQTLALAVPPAQPWNEPPRSLQGFASSGLPVTLTVVNGPATLTDNVLSFTGAGTVVIRATQAGDARHAPAPPLERSVVGLRATPVLTWNTPPSLSTGTILTAAVLNATATPPAGTWTYSPAAGTTLNTPGIVTLSATFTPTDATNYEPATLTRSMAVTAPGTPPVFTVHPQGQTLTAGTTLQLSATVTGSTPLTYQWLRDGQALTADARTSGVNLTALAITGMTLADAGAYRLRATNAAGESFSNAANVAVLPAGLAATHTLPAGGYVAGTTLTVEATLAYPGTASSLGWQLLLPPGVSYAGGSGAEGDIRPAAGQTGVLEWAWSTPPLSPVVFRTLIGVPAGQTGNLEFSALAIARLSGTASPFQVLVKPDPLVAAPALHHSADTNRDYRLGLLELTRVIELYNTRNGTSRTGCYKVEDGSEDGYGAEPTRASSAAASLARHHSADSNRDGKIGLLELTRVIELYNYREGTSRTGRYKLQAGTEDGFAPGN